MYATAWALLPAGIAILLALLTKEVYSSLFIGIIVGGALYLLYVTVLQTQLPTGALWKLFK